MAPRLPHLTTRLQGLGTSVFTEMTALAVRHGAANLAQGFPDFEYGPRPLREAVKRGLDSNMNQYCRSSGLPSLVQAVAAHERRFYGLEYDPMEEVTVTSGATEAVFATVQALCEVGDEVLCFEPFYDSYRASIRMAGAVPKYVKLRARPSAGAAAQLARAGGDRGGGAGFTFDPDELRRAVTDRTRLVLLNTPHNPTGKVFSHAELAHVARLAEERDLIVVTDEVYEHLTYGGVAHVPITAHFPALRDRCVRISSAGKTFGVTGWKVGTVCANRALSAAVRAAHQFVTFSTSTPMQHALAEQAYTLPDAFFANLRSDFERRRDLLCEGLARAGLHVVGDALPEGGYFAVVDAAAIGFPDDVAFTKMLPERVGVAAVPVSAFYDDAGDPANRRHVRFAFCKSDETLAKALKQLERLRHL